MSDSDYAVLRRVVEWLQQHAGNDAPEYSELETATRVVDNIARRRQPDSSKQRYPPLLTWPAADTRPPSTADDAERTASRIDDDAG